MLQYIKSFVVVGDDQAQKTEYVRKCLLASEVCWPVLSSLSRFCEQFEFIRHDIGYRLQRATVVGGAFQASDVNCLVKKGWDRFSRLASVLLVSFMCLFTHRQQSQQQTFHWNALPSHLWQDLNYRHFNKWLKGHTLYLTPRTVVRECCKGDDESQLEMGKIWPPATQKPLNRWSPKFV